MATLAQTVSFVPTPSSERLVAESPGTPQSGAGPSTATLSSINAQLISHGWAKRPLNLSKLSEKDHAEVIRVLFELLGSSVSNLNNFDDLAARHRTLSYEHERLNKQHAQSRSSMTRLEAEVTSWKVRCTEMEKRYSAEEVKVKELREEVARGRKALEGVRVAAGHEAKKNQLKLDKAQAQLLKLSNDASATTRPQGLLLLNPISGGRTHPIAPVQPILLEQSVKDLAEIRQGLQEEAEAFRHVVVTTSNALREALAAREGQDAPPRLLHSQFFSVPRSDPLHRSLIYQSASSTAHPTIADARLKTLVAQVRQKLTEGVPKRVFEQAGAEATAAETDEEAEERKRLEREQERMRVELEEKVKDLEVEITCVRAREEEAQRLVEELAKQQAAERVGRIVQDEPENRDEEYQSLRDQQKKLDEDRRRFAEASARLEHQRQTLEAEREAFQDERQKVETETILALLPASPGQNASPGPSSPSRNGWHHRPSSPSPLSPHKVRTPRPVSVGKKRTKAPLSRLVLEKAVRQKGKESATAFELERLESSVLLENGRKGNVRSTKTASAPKTPSLGSSLARSTLKSTANQATQLGGANSGQSREIRESGFGRDLAKADGLGPRAASTKGARVWR